MLRHCKKIHSCFTEISCQSAMLWCSTVNLHFCCKVWFLTLQNYGFVVFLFFVVALVTLNWSRSFYGVKYHLSLHCRQFWTVVTAAVLASFDSSEVTEMKRRPKGVLHWILKWGVTLIKMPSHPLLIITSLWNGVTVISLGKVTLEMFTWMGHHTWPHVTSLHFH